MNKKYALHIQGFDCPSCAKHIEDSLNELDPAHKATFDFATNILYLYSNDIKATQQKIHNLKPNLQITESTDSITTPEDSLSLTKPLFIPLATLLALFSSFILGILFLHISPLTSLPYASNIGFAILSLTYLIAGFPVFKTTLNNLKNKIIFDENFLMFFATIAAFCIGEISEAVAVMLFFRTGELLESLAVQRSKRSIQALLSVMPEIAHKKTESKILDIAPKELEINDEIIIKVGEKIPTDGIVIKGESFLDMRSLNGESVPVKVKEGEKVSAGAINTSAILEVRVEAKFQDSQIAKIRQLVQEASANKANTQKLITRFAQIYTPIMFILALCVGVIPPLLDLGSWQEWIYRALVVMMISCPCALVISVPLGYFATIGRASTQGILFKGSIHIENLAEVTNIVFDKTGTLTMGNFEILEIIPAPSSYDSNTPTINQERLLDLAICAEWHSNHPIATCIKGKANKDYSPLIESFEEISGKGIIAQTSQGKIMLGNAKLMEDYGIDIEHIQTSHTIIHIAKNMQYMGYILIGDKLKDNAQETLDALKKAGIKHLGILSGDRKKSVESLAQNLKIESAFGELLPAQKAEMLKNLKTQWGGKIAFVGDGINDAVVLRTSDVGVSINTNEYGNDISKESADIVLRTPSLMGLLNALHIAKHTKLITWQNISFALGSKAILVILGVLGIANMWLAVFGDVGVALLALMNAMRVGKMGK